ncbi:MAG: hypothetical protein LBU34_12525 [Planctomycetaceae bacterium]|jgi:hypothetical protein|nr:hypothetical protein [Planctomycetaceae bacterium]
MRLNKTLAFLTFGVIFGFFTQTISAYYSPEVGRFISRDPIEYEAGDVNVYRYVSSNTITYNDPSGLACCDNAEYDPTTQGCCDKTIYDLATQCCKNKSVKTKFLLCIRCESSHCWMYAKDLSSGNEHTYGRWMVGYGTAKSSGVQIDAELKRGHSCERCTQVCDYKPTLGNGYGCYANNCASYAQSEWMRWTGEILNATAWYSGDHPIAYSTL